MSKIDKEALQLSAISVAYLEDLIKIKETDLNNLKQVLASIEREFRRKGTASPAAEHIYHSTITEPKRHRLVIKAEKRLLKAYEENLDVRKHYNND